jgi:hypothetical protein
MITREPISGSATRAVYGEFSVETLSFLKASQLLVCSLPAFEENSTSFHRAVKELADRQLGLDDPARHCWPATFHVGDEYEKLARNT